MSAKRTLNKSQILRKRENVNRIYKQNLVKQNLIDYTNFHMNISKPMPNQCQADINTYHNKYEIIKKKIK